MDLRALSCLLVLLPVAVGCITPLPQPPETISSIREPSSSNLRPGAQCKIDMRLPPSATGGSYQRYSGTISEVNDEEIVLVKALEESRVEYGSGHRRPPTSQSKEMVRVPISGIGAIQVSDPPAAATAAQSPPGSEQAPSPELPHP